ncbi:MAG: DUF2793 domain-containing protein, partial [Proteobacteria bacterium]|nr:DUF2793 domain-containing protein [Pseudomonadota bacterium]
WNDNALRQLISNASVNNSTTAQPALTSPADDGKCYIIQSTHTGAQWATFTPKSIAVFYGGGWYEGKPTEGFRISVGGAPYIYTSGAWTVFSSGASDMLSPLTSAEISVTAAANATLGRMHVCSGTSADYALTLPAASGNAGKLIGVRISSACTRWITVTGNGAELIDGINTRRMWAKESAILLCDGTGWTKIAGRTVPLQCTMRRTTAFSVTQGAWRLLPMLTTVSDNASALATPLGDTTNGYVRCLRGGTYSVTGFAGLTGLANTTANGFGVINRKNSVPGGYSINDPQDDPSAWNAMIKDSAGGAYGNVAGIFRGVLVGDSLACTIFNSDTVARNTTAAITNYPSISVTEIPDW